jgi:hypothetical protein
MPVVALALLLFALGIGCAGIWRAIHELRTPSELRGDWWGAFEQEFRSYAARSTRETREPERRRDRGERFSP